MVTAQRRRTESICKRLWLPLYGPCVTSEHGIKEGEKPVYPEKNPQSQIEINKSQPTYGARESPVAEVGSASNDRYANLTK